MSGGKGGGQVIGYKYYLGIDFSWCHAPADRCTALWLDNREIFRGCLEDQDTILIDKPELFGEVEGGIRGYVDAEFGAETQLPNTYTVSQTGSDTPAYRGVTRTVFRGNSEDGGSRSCYVGNNPYLKRINGEFQRIYKRIRDGAVVDQWQSSIAGVPLIDPDAAVNFTDGFVSGELQDQSLFINLDLSSASNGYTGNSGTITGNGLNAEDIKASVIQGLLDIRDRFTWATEPTTDISGNETNDSGLDIGIGYTRFTTAAANNTSNNPNNVDPNLAPIPGVAGSTYDLPKRGWIMKEKATRADIDELIEFVNEMVVVPDTIPSVEDRQLLQLIYDNTSEAFASLSTTNLRGLINYSGLVTDETIEEMDALMQDLTAVLTTNSGGDEPIKSVHSVSGISQYNTSGIRVTDTIGTSGSAALASHLGSPVDPTNINLTGGGWYLVDNVSTTFDGPLQSDYGSDDAFAIGDDSLTTNPAGGGPTDQPFALPQEGDQLWIYGPLKGTGIYAQYFDVTYHYQRADEDQNEPTTVSINRGGEEQVWQPYNSSDTPFTAVSQTNEEAVGVYVLNLCGGYVEMNPAHIIRECLTDQQWGLGLPESEIDETTFAAAAQTLYDERFGLSMAWTRETPIEDFVNNVLNHIDAVLYVDRSDGLWKLVLIRDDYDPDTLTEFTDADVVAWSEVNIKSPAELVNSVTVKYNSRELEGPASLTVHNFAQRQKLGKTISTTVNYPGIWQDTLATRVAQRDLITLSTSLIAGEVELTRKAYDLAPGDVFKLTSSRYNLSGEIMRVVEVNVGDGRQNSVRVTFTQDKYNFAYSTDTDLVNAPAPEFVDPTSGDPDTVEDRLVTEEPYYLFVNRYGELVADEIITKEENIGFPFASANKPTSQSVYARFYYDDGSGYKLGPQVSYGPYAEVAEELREEADLTTLTISGFRFYEDVEVNDLIAINNEIMSVESIDSTTQLTVGRGALDTVPAFHRVGDPVFFISSSKGVITTGEYVASDTIDIKLLDATTSSRLDPALALTDTLTLDNRLIKPYGVGQLQLDGAYRTTWSYATGETISVTWVHRDRTLQTGSNPPIHTDSSVGPETGSDYTISAVAYDISGEEITSIGNLFSVDKNQNTSHTINTDSYSPSSEGTVEWSAVGVRVKNTREDSSSVTYENWQTPEVMAYVPLTLENADLLRNSAWIDVNVLASMYQDDEKTTAVSSDGDPVGYIENQKDTF